MPVTDTPNSMPITQSLTADLAAVDIMIVLIDNLFSERILRE